MTVLFDLPDGGTTSSLYLSTSQDYRFVTGVLPAAAVNAEVSILGSGFTSNVESILIEGTSFTVPNPEFFPDGLLLNAGPNQIEIRPVLTTGTGDASLAIFSKVESSPSIEVLAPTGLRAERRSSFVRLFIDRYPGDLGSFTDGIVGYNIYASTVSGGGPTGYTRVNLRPLADYFGSTIKSPVGDFAITSELIRDTEDPAINLRYVVQQVRNDGTVVSTDYDQMTTVPDTLQTIESLIQAQDSLPVRTYTFDHFRVAGTSSTPATIFNSSFNNLGADALLYYVMTAIYYDPDTGSEYESSFSPEIASRPSNMANVVGNLPVATADTVRNTIVQSIYRANPDVSVQPGSVLRDTFIDPLSSESERLRFIIDFFYRSSSFQTLLAVDDPSNSGSSVPVGQSSYKRALRQALFLSSDQATQALIDRAFEKLASDYGVSRLTGNKAQGSVTFFVRNTPQRTITVPVGTQISLNGNTFRITQLGQIPLQSVASYFDPINNRYFFTVAAQAVLSGSSGNLAKGQLRGSLEGVNYINESRFFGGTNQDTNRQLAERAMNRLSSVDTGTASGIRYLVSNVPGVIQSRVVGPGDPLMFRDVDASGSHLGGKVDVWVQGSADAVVSDTFAFTFDVVQDAQFLSVGSPSNLIFRCLSAEVTVDNPIVEILDDASLFLGLRDASTGNFFDVTGVTFLDYRTIQLDSGIPQPAFSLTNIILGDFRFRASNSFVFDQQPAQRILSVAGEVSGLLSSSQYTLNRTDSFLLTGRSTQSSDSVSLTLTTTEEITVTGEGHVIVGLNPEYLNRLGVNPFSIRVFNPDRTIEYAGAFGSGSADFTILPGTDTTPTAILRVAGGLIASGQSVVVDYLHAENFVVRYETNAVIEAVQSSIDQNKHITADVLAKASLPVPVEISATLVLDVGANRGTVDSSARSSFSDFFNQFRTDNPLRQSDIIALLEEVPGVSYVIQPLTKLSRADGSYVVDDRVPSSLPGDSFLIPSWSTSTSLVWILVSPLTASTTTAGGSDNQFRAIYQDGSEIPITRTPPSLLGNQSEVSYIIGAEGLVIPGYSDDSTLLAQGFSGQRAVQRRIEITSNRILLSLPSGDSPTSHQYSATYIVAGNSGVRNINPGPTEFLTLGNVDLVYDEATENSLQRVNR